MTTTRLALDASLATAAFWTAKAAAIALTGGQSNSSPAGVLFLLGLLCFLVALASTALALARRRRSRSARIATGLGVVLAVAAVGAVTMGLVAAVQPADPGWAWGEVNLWVAMLVLVGLNLSLSRRRAVTTGPGAWATTPATR